MMIDDNPGDDDIEIFQKEMENVKPLKPDNKVTQKPKREKMRNIQRSQAEAARYEVNDNFSDSPVEDCPERLSFSRGGLQHSVLKKLRTGKIPIESELDLHGMTVAEAHKALLYFIAECQDLGCRCALVVHGKGYSSPHNKPIIKAYVNRWLQESTAVLAFCSAQPKDGGIGAAYVLLKKEEFSM